MANVAVFFITFILKTNVLVSHSKILALLCQGSVSGESAKMCRAKEAELLKQI
jgi:hypothetical protein